MTAEDTIISADESKGFLLNFWTCCRPISDKGAKSIPNPI
ncbi:hypothetical protein SPAR155_0017 [Streptococcus pneumoniae GA04672]|nr:hypothetical protein CGSSp14BS69_05742 [Streptococcus pneumoniae SP14-BS69]EDK68696.1 hypothetical protein CGSSp18BS74_06147 [Streptococcus pneumoniae SP18-BS74]EDK77870.1 hypothetical protein CGSSp9BS68_02918 [Streptococcus pneumoniae SP9-BS68]EHD40878.1 hypothetical protein SPAR87_0015 [Streptococcus pneumoniae GA47033]EHE29899.1 hypothetical protein SPAR78_0060 [Streptococcus pneumoniae GA43380]EHE33850.1 hypothetical protein SPAR92_0016 [Streptococcus pneumoniae GA47360]EJG81231.1 hypo